MNRFPQKPILIVDDELEIIRVFDSVLQSGGINNIIPCQDSREVSKILGKQEIEVILLDLMMPHVGGEEILQRVVQDYPEIPVIMITGVYEVGSAVQCMKFGAFDYLLKPIDAGQLLISVRRAIEMRELRLENSLLTHRFLSDSLERPEVFRPIITQNNKMRSIFQYCEAIARGQHPVLITGETGTGKELIAKALHDLSGRQGKYLAVNVAGLDDTVFSDTLFGHTRGAFTGADAVRQGIIESAKDGTLMLDEIGDLSDVSQVKLLRLLEQREYFPVGADIARQASVRILVTTHRNLEELQRSGKFRGDLYYRLCNHHVNIPPLRERKEDIPLLLEHFLIVAANEFGKKKPIYPQELPALLQSYHFPGNVRELKTMILDAVSTHRGRQLSTEAFRSLMKGKGKSQRSSAIGNLPADSTWASGLTCLPKLKEATQILVEEALRRANNNQKTAALMLGISPQALSKRLKRKK